MSGTDITIDEHLLARFVPMSALEEKYLRELSAHAELVSLEPGDTLEDDLASVESTYYVVDGSLCLTGGGLADVTVDASEPASRFALPGAETVGRHARSIDGARLLRVDRAKISTLLIWAQASTPSGDDSDGRRVRADITSLLLQSRLFERIPPSNIERIGELIEPVALDAGATVVSQGEPGDYYYVIERGRCEVLREPDDGSDPVRLAELGEGESFGEEALLTASRRNATVRMITEGSVLRLTRSYFVELVSAPLLQIVSHERAEDLIGTGARWMDVRLREEFDRDGLDDAINIPLGELRGRLSELDAAGSYVTYCNTGRRAQAGAFLLSQRGVHACTLRDGIARRRPASRGASRQEESLQALHAALAAADAELDEALQRKAEADAARDVEARLLDRSDEESAAQERLDRLTGASQDAEDALREAMGRKRELETRVRDAEADATSRRKAAEVECERMRAEAQARLDEERKQLEARYREASERLQGIEAARRQAEAHFEAERERIQRELEEARARMEAEAARIRETMEQARQEAEGKVEAIRRDHSHQEEALRRETEEALREERARLEDDFAISIAAQDKARQLLEQAETARREAHKEIERLRSEASAEIASRREEQSRRRAEEVSRLRDKSEAAKARLDAAQRARDDAEQRHEKFSATFVELSASDADRKASMEQELQGFKRELDSADDALSQAEAEHASATTEQTLAEEKDAATRARAEELRLQLYEEMESWIAEEEERSREELEKAERYAQQMERMQAEKDARKAAAEAATEDMFSDIENLLSGGADEGLDVAMRSRLAAEEKAKLVQRARREVAEQTEQARARISRGSGD